MAVPSKIIIYKENDQFIEVVGIADGLNPASYINNANFTCTLKDRDGETVTGIDALAMTYAPDSDGIYRAAVPDSFDPPKGGGYTLHINGSIGPTDMHLEIAVEVRVRKS